MKRGGSLGVLYYNLCTVGVLAFLLIQSCTISVAEIQFQDATPADFPGLTETISSWQDFNGDNFPDLILSGTDGTNRGDIWINNGDGSFAIAPFSTTLPDVRQGCMAFADVNQDGQLDFFFMGSNQTGSNEGGVYLRAGPASVDYTFLANQPFMLTWQCSAGFLDIDQDTFPDLFLCGPWSCSLYKNNHGQGFSDVTGSYPAVGTFQGSTVGGCHVGDYNKDGFSDVFAMGMKIGGSESAIFKGGASSLVNSGVSLVGLVYGRGKFADFNQDTFPDLIMTGYDGSTVAQTLLYVNDRSGGFSLASNTGLPGMQYSAVDVGDFTADGYPDILVCGYSSGQDHAYLFKNNRDMTFTDIGANLTGMESCSANFVDYNKDGLLDVFLSGSLKTKLYKNIGPACINGFTSIKTGLGWTCTCYDGWSGSDCSAPLCPGIRCLTTGACAQKLADCVVAPASTTTGGVSSGGLVSEKVVAAQVIVDTSVETSIDFISNTDASLRGKITIPPDLFGTGTPTDALLTINSVSVDVIKNTNVPLSNIFSVVIDLSFSDNLPSTFAQPITITLAVDNLPVGSCLGYLQGNQWVCEDSNLVIESNGQVSGKTSHFTAFGVLLDSSDNNNNGDGGDGFDNILLIPIILSVVGACGVVVVVTAVLLVIVWWRRKKIRDSLMNSASSTTEA